MRYFIQFGLSVIITCSIGYAENLKECLSEEDKIQGCVKKLWFSNGYGLVLETPYKNGKLDGIEKRYYLNNGNLEQETPYKDGKLDGIAKYYSKNGNLIATMTYKKGEAISAKCANGKVLSGEYPFSLDEIDMHKTCG